MLYPQSAAIVYVWFALLATIVVPEGEIVPCVPAPAEIENPLTLVSSAPGVGFVAFLGWQSKSLVTLAIGTPIPIVGLLPATRCKSLSAAKTGSTSIEFASLEVAAVQSAKVA